jgi:archaellum component FlaC
MRFSIGFITLSFTLGVSAIGQLDVEPSPAMQMPFDMDQPTPNDLEEMKGLSAEYEKYSSQIMKLMGDLENSQLPDFTLPQEGRDELAALIDTAVFDISETLEGLQEATKDIEESVKESGRETPKTSNFNSLKRKRVDAFETLKGQFESVDKLEDRYFQFDK